MTEYSVPELVQRGAEFLDERIPGWVDRIDTGSLDISSSVNCILGQLYSGRRTDVSPYLDHRNELGLSIAESASMGFASSSTEVSQQLDREWTRVISNCRIAAAAPAPTPDVTRVLLTQADCDNLNLGTLVINGETFVGTPSALIAKLQECSV